MILKGTPYRGHEQNIGKILFYLYWQIDMVTSVGIPVSMPSTSKANLLCKRETEVSIVKVRVRVSPTSVLLIILK